MTTDPFPVAWVFRTTLEVPHLPFDKPNTMITTFLKYWWTFVVRGILALLFGLVCLLAPGMTLALLAVWAGAFVLVDGVFGLVATIANWKELEEKWLLIIESLLGILLGWLIMRMPEVTLFMVVMFMAMWALFVGVTRIALAIRLRKEIEGEGWMIAAGVLTIGMGVLLILLPGIGLVTLAVLLGVGSLEAGGALIAVGMRMRKAHRAAKKVSGQ